MINDTATIWFNELMTRMTSAAQVQHIVEGYSAGVAAEMADQDMWNMWFQLNSTEQ